MTEWDCRDSNEGIGGEFTCRKTAADHNKEYGIHLELLEVKPSGSHDVVVKVEFFRDWGKSTITETITPGDYRMYTDPDGADWGLYVYNPIYNGILSSAKLQICCDDLINADDGIDDEIYDEPDGDIPTDEEYPPKSELATDLSSIFGDIDTKWIVLGIIALIILGLLS